MTILLTTALRVILIGVPTSTKRPTSLGHPTTFSTVSPSILKVRWYPACLLELRFRSRNRSNQEQVTLYYFHSLFMDYRPPNIFISYFKLNPKVSSSTPERIIFLFKELFKEWRKEETLRPSKLGTFTTSSLHLSYKGKNVFGNNQTFL